MVLRILGCDPGLKGALALLELDADHRVQNLVLSDMPVGQVRVGRGVRTQLQEARLAQLVRNLSPDVAYVEAVHSMPLQGIASSFAFGMAFGILRGILAACLVPTTLTTPQEWQRIVRLGGDGPDRARQRALQLFPAYARLFDLKKHEGRADAALIALAGARIGGGI